MCAVDGAVEECRVARYCSSLELCSRLTTPHPRRALLSFSLSRSSPSNHTACNTHPRLSCKHPLPLPLSCTCLQQRLQFLSRSSLKMAKEAEAAYMQAQKEMQVYVQELQKLEKDFSKCATTLSKFESQHTENDTVKKVRAFPNACVMQLCRCNCAGATVRRTGAAGAGAGLSRRLTAHAALFLPQP